MSLAVALQKSVCANALVVISAQKKGRVDDAGRHPTLFLEPALPIRVQCFSQAFAICTGGVKLIE